jgi:hypothetical protein
MDILQIYYINISAYLLVAVLWLRHHLEILEQKVRNSFFRVDPGNSPDVNLISVDCFVP